MINFLFFKKIDKYINKHKTTLEFMLPKAPVSGNGKSKGNDIDYDKLNLFVDKNSDRCFSKILFDFIDRSGKTDSEIYKVASVDRRVFSKIRCNKNYIPKKRTIIAIGLALKLTKTDFDNLLLAAGYSLSYSDVFDLIIMYCIENKIYSIAKINIALEHYGINLFNTED